MQLGPFGSCNGIIMQTGHLSDMNTQVKQEFDELTYKGFNSSPVTV